MFYYIKDSSIIHKSTDLISSPFFSYDKYIEAPFIFSDLVVFENDKIIPYNNSKLYSRISGLDKVEIENEKLEKKLANQEKIVNNIVTSYDTIVAENNLLKANRQKG